MNNMNIEYRIKDKGLKVTTPRLNIINMLDKCDKPICYNDIKDTISMDKATFYRTMSSFEETNIVTVIDSGDSKKYYELNKVPHSHFSCTKCHTIKCLPNNYLIKIDGCEIESVTIHGKCENCNS